MPLRGLEIWLLLACGVCGQEGGSSDPAVHLVAIPSTAHACSELVFSGAGSHDPQGGAQFFWSLGANSASDALLAVLSGATAANSRELTISPSVLSQTAPSLGGRLEVELTVAFADENRTNLTVVAFANIVGSASQAGTKSRSTTKHASGDLRNQTKNLRCWLNPLRMSHFMSYHFTSFHTPLFSRPGGLLTGAAGDFPGGPHSAHHAAEREAGAGGDHRRGQLRTGLRRQRSQKRRGPRTCVKCDNLKDALVGLLLVTLCSSCAQSSMCLLFHAFMLSCIHVCVCLHVFTHLFISCHWFIHPLIHSLTHSLIHLFMHASKHS